MRRNDMRDEDQEIIIENGSNSILTFLAGVTVGAVVALLFAPQTGEETRREIRRRAEKARKDASRMAEDFGDVVSERFQEAREYVEDGIDKAKHTFDARKRQVERAVEAGREAAKETRENLEQRLNETKAAFEEGREVARSARRSSATSRRADETATEL